MFIGGWVCSSRKMGTREPEENPCFLVMAPRTFVRYYSFTSYCRPGLSRSHSHSLDLHAQGHSSRCISKHSPPKPFPLTGPSFDRTRHLGPSVGTPASSAPHNGISGCTLHIVLVSRLGRMKWFSGSCQDLLLFPFSFSYSPSVPFLWRIPLYTRNPAHRVPSHLYMRD